MERVTSMDQIEYSVPEGVYLAKLAALMEEQVSFLRRFDERENARDLSKHPMPEVPATNSTAWNALLRSALADTIHPKVERWRSGLDALLVFLGLFSAIVTSFFVQSLSALSEDPAVRTNQLLANLTDIIIVLSAVSPASVRVQQPTVFHPDSTDLRLNSLWSLSLILSLSIAALAVACRGFLNTVEWSRFTKASEKLIDIRTRWISSERFLGPTIEALPQLLVIPVLLFIAGLLDTLFSSVLQLSSPPLSILITSVISLLFISAVAVLLCYTVAQRSLNPSGPPFGTAMFRLMRRPTQLVYDDKIPDMLSDKASSVYHEVVQETHDDDALNQASAALYNIIQSLSVWPRYGCADIGLSDQERATFMHLLSPEASVRSNRTAVQVILRIHESNRIQYSSTDMSELIPSLLRAASRLPSRDCAIDLWDSLFVRAMAIIGNASTLSNHLPPILAFLGSEYINYEHLPSDNDPTMEHAVRTKTVSCIVDILFRKLSTALAELPTSMSEDELVDQILSSEKPAQTTTVSAVIDPGKLIAALLYLPHPQNSTVLRLIVRWLVRTTSPLTVLRATQTRVAAVTHSDVWPTVLFFVASVVARVCLAEPSPPPASNISAVAELCVGALLKIADFHQFHAQLPTLVGMTVEALTQLGEVDSDMIRDLEIVRSFLEDDTWRWSGKHRGEVLAQLKSLQAGSVHSENGTLSGLLG